MEELNATDISAKIKSQFSVMFNSGVNQFHAGNYEKAKETFLKAMPFGIELSKCTKSIASCCQMLEEYSQAIDFYKLSLLYNKSANIDCYHFIGVCAVKDKQFNIAIENLQQYLEATAKIESSDVDESALKSAKLYLKIAKQKLAELNKKI